MTEKNVYEITITVKPIPRRESGVLGFVVPVRKESTKDIMEYGCELAEIIKKHKEEKKNAKLS